MNADDDPVLRGKQCHSWFKMVVWQFSRLYTADDRARAEEFTESRRFFLRIKSAFWEGRKRDDVICEMIEGFWPPSYNV